MKRLICALAVIAAGIFYFALPSAYCNETPSSPWWAEGMKKISKDGAFTVCKDTVHAVAKDGGRVIVVYTIRFRETYVLSQLRDSQARIKALEKALESMVFSGGGRAHMSPPWEVVELIPNVMYTVQSMVCVLTSSELHNNTGKFVVAMRERLTPQLAAMCCLLDSLTAEVHALALR